MWKRIVPTCLFHGNSSRALLWTGTGLTCSKALMGQIARVETLSLSLALSLRASSCSTDRRHLWFVAQIATNSWQVFAAFFLFPPPPSSFLSVLFLLFLFFFFPLLLTGRSLLGGMSLFYRGRNRGESQCFTTVGEASSLRSVKYILLCVISCYYRLCNVVQLENFSLITRVLYN